MAEGLLWANEMRYADVSLHQRRGEKALQQDVKFRQLGFTNPCIERRVEAITGCQPKDNFRAKASSDMMICQSGLPGVCRAASRQRLGGDQRVRPGNRVPPRKQADRIIPGTSKSAARSASSSAANWSGELSPAFNS